MTKCPIYNEEMISLYVEGALDDNESKMFEHHLMECDICLRSVIDLRNDLFKLNLYENKIYKNIFLVEAAFLLIKGKLILLRELGLNNHFEKVEAVVPFRGNKDRSVYKMNVNDITVIIGNDGSEKFLVEVKNTIGFNLELFSEDRLIEAHNNIKRKNVVMAGLERGEYILSLKDLKKGKENKIKIRIN